MIWCHAVLFILRLWTIIFVLSVNIVIDEALLSRAAGDVIEDFFPLRWFGKLGQHPAIAPDPQRAHRTLPTLELAPCGGDRDTDAGLEFLEPFLREVEVGEVTAGIRNPTEEVAVT